MTRLHQILIGLLVVQIALAGVVFWPRSTSASAGQALFGAVKAEEITTLTVTDKDGKSVRMAKQGDTWVLPDAEAFPADAGKITPLLTKITQIKTARLVTRTADSHAKLQVADDAYASRVEFGAPSGTYALFIGSATGGSTHVRAAGQNEVYLAGDLKAYDVQADPSTWINAQYLSVAQADVTSVSLKNANGEFSFTKDAQGAWQMAGLQAGEQLNANNVIGLISQAGMLRMTRPLGKTDKPEYGMAQPLAVVTLKAKKDNTETTYNLTIGAKDAADGSYVVKLASSEYYVRVAEYGVQEAVERKRDAFLVQPTPVPAAGTPQAAPAK